ncbi:DMT family transporter [Bacillus sp. ISL-47]|uniref:DMT family transporter n=1 Tax=Bacillus sp. ISL-47 TaxID=2819130 RepID=UPI001BEC228B|nr:DMT family transporter [Bacillus sp. ISL-47]MBT2687432.1 DMT family transporter [Bacillus sp. ISL-47]MBT2707106.1 DMT family transporter [Pseudomonas sp. ISL-84]
MSRIGTYLILVFVMMMWGLNVVAIKILIEYFPPILMQSTRIFLGGLLLVLFFWWRKNLQRMNRKEWLVTISAGVLGVTGHHLFLAIGLLETTASNAGIILALSPLTTSILGILFLHDQLTKMRLLGICLGFGGVLFVVLNGGGQLGGISLGDFLIFMAMLTQAFSFILIKRNSQSVNPKFMTAVMLTAGSIVMFLFSFFIDTEGISSMAVTDIRVWILFLLSGVVATGMGQLLYNIAIQNIGPGQTTIFNNLMPFFTLLGSVLFLKETILLEQIIGFLFIVAGVVLGTGYVDEYIVSKRKEKVYNSFNG